MALTNSATPVVTNAGDNLAIDPISGAVIGIDPASNDVAISQTGSENKVQISQTAGENGVDLVKLAGAAITGGVLPVSIESPGDEIKDTGTVNLAAANPSPTTGTIDFTEITTGKTAHLLKLVGFAQFQVQVKIKGTDAAEFVFTGNGSGGGPINLDLPRGFITQVGGTGKKFTATGTNLHKNEAVDLDLTALWVEV